MFELHSHHMLINAMKKFKDDQPYFESMFPEIAQTLRTKYYNLFIASDILIDKAYQKKETKVPQIIIRQAQSNLMNTQLLSNGGPTVKSMLIRNDLILKLYAPQHDFIRIISRLIQSAFLIFKRSFLEAGYMNLDFVASQELTPADDSDLQDIRGIRHLSSEDGFMYSMEMIYTSQRLLEVEPLVADREVDVSVIMSVPQEFGNTSSPDLHTDTLYTTIVTN